MITSYLYGDFDSSGNVAPVRASSSLSPLKPQRGRKTKDKKGFTV